ncbi:MAG TPA: STAS/SEC14 domain-containing protein [Pseudomonadales bacterium]|nr:STAS/SEC14 domain-containing protein [Pseudomonadales bacterium]HMW14134.1 STAS/SEC14 domain-containing protein [Pseudomonadales bacterium]HMW83417.1 STAS/SEC14 domain-containing protein [Pseudomonadales bacterium]HMY96345.1 STAS/SEC14 domain-containing protein [Pseudomonadales bacterium]HMZ70991.1 STAS/SEC14 domain-containing protein [Pseudomonadales bacterium]
MINPDDLWVESFSKMDVEIVLKEKFLHVRASGHYSLDEMNAMSRAMFAALQQHPRASCLIDCSQVTGSPTLNERFEWPRFTARLIEDLPAIQRQTRFAFVASEPFLDPGRFGETVAVNRGVNVVATDSLDEALRWLGVETGSA